MSSLEELLEKACEQAGPLKRVSAYKRLPFYLLKLLNRDRYYALKHELELKSHVNKSSIFWKRWKKYSSEYYSPLDFNCIASASFKHSGNAGDLIYSLPTVRALSASAPASLRLALGVPMKGPFAKAHPVGGVMLNESMYQLLEPLLVAQSYINDVAVFNNETIDYDLDVFRESPILTDRMNIARWYFHFFLVSVNLAEPWLKVDKNDSYKNTVILARSHRYRNYDLDFSILNRYDNIVFVGVESEYSEMQKCLPKLEWLQVKDFLEMAQAIAGCRLFIGNQSFPFSVAEALKVPRILEVDPMAPNVVPEGGSAHEILFQREFVYWVGKTLDVEN